MSITLTVDSFVTGAKQSTLIEAEMLDRFIAESGKPFESATALADALVDRGFLTRWQADKLLQGKYRGFKLGRYRLKQLLGKGEMSSVYLAEHIRMKRPCAIKVLPAHKVRETSYLGRFHREAEAVAQLDHPNIVRAYDVDVEEEAGTEIHYLVMEYVVGRSLDKQVVEDGPLGIIKAADAVRQAAAGLSHAHAAGLVHRDIKPGNLLVDESGVVKILDLGLARFFKDQDQESLTIKHDEKVLGTADYLAPEQAVDSHAVDARADIYALGCTLFFVLTQRPPFADGTLVQRLLAHQTQQAPAVDQFREDCPEELDEILQKMMAKDPAERFQTADDVVGALSDFLVSYADHDWRRKNVDVVASVRGVDRLISSSESGSHQPDGPELADRPAAVTTEPVNAVARSLPIKKASSASKAKKKRADKPDVAKAAKPKAKKQRRPSIWQRVDKSAVAVLGLMVAAAFSATAFVIQLEATEDSEAADVSKPATPVESRPADQPRPLPFFDEGSHAVEPSFGLSRQDSGASAK